MKTRILILSIFLLPSIVVSGQTFSDDFEGYTANNYLAQSSAKWTTWNGVEGGATDVKVSAVKAHGGANAVYFSSSVSTGGPTDVVLPFGGQYNSGHFAYDMWLFVENGKGAYFNFQEQSVVGKGWSFETKLNADGTLVFTNTPNGTLLSGSYPKDQWFKIGLDIDLNTNTWNVLINGVSIGSFQNTYRQIASLNIYPNNGNGFYLDDLSYTYTPFTKPNLNAALTSIDQLSGFLATSKTRPSVEIRNLGNAVINSVNISLSYNGNTLNKTASGLNLASGNYTSILMDEELALLPGNSVVTAEIKSVNGGADDYTSDNSKQLNLNPVVPATGRVVIAEEATGTWCSWCPRGAVKMKEMDEKHSGFFVGIAVHNNDPMEVGMYDVGLGNLISGYPSSVVDRGGDIDPSDMEADFLERIVTPAPVTMKIGGKWNQSNRVFDLSVTTKLETSITGNHRLICVLTEDSVTGTTSGYNQSNSYAGGNNGKMGGYELLPSSVPASKMVYDHVARVVAPNFLGQPNAFSSNTGAGATHVHNFSFQISPLWNLEHMKAVCFMTGSDSRIDNGNAASLRDAIDLGFTQGTQITGIEPLDGPDSKLSVYPNPALGPVHLSWKPEQKIYQVVIIAADGREVWNQPVNAPEGIQISTAEWASGVYTIIAIGNNGNLHQLLVKK